MRGFRGCGEGRRRSSTMSGGGAVGHGGAGDCDWCKLNHPLFTAAVGFVICWNW